MKLINLAIACLLLTIPAEARGGFGGGFHSSSSFHSYSGSSFRSYSTPSYTRSAPISGRTTYTPSQTATGRSWFSSTPRTTPTVKPVYKPYVAPVRVYTRPTTYYPRTVYIHHYQPVYHSTFGNSWMYWWFWWSMIHHNRNQCPSNQVYQNDGKCR